MEKLKVFNKISVLMISMIAVLGITSNVYAAPSHVFDFGTPLRQGTDITTNEYLQSNIPNIGSGKDYGVTSGSNDDFAELVQVYPQLRCIDRSTGTQEYYDSNLRLKAILDINSSEKAPASVTGYYTGGYKNTLSSDKDAGVWAYIASLASAPNVNKQIMLNGGRDGFRLRDLWYNYVNKTKSQNLLSFTRRVGGAGDETLGLIGISEYNTRTGGDDWKELTKNSNSYGDFAKNLQDAGGKTLVVNDNNKKFSQDGKTITGIKFDKFIVDSGEYVDLRVTYGGGKPIYPDSQKVTDQKITAEAVFEDGSKVEITANNIEGIDDLRKIEAGKSYTITLEQAANKKVVSIKFKSTYHTYKGRIFVVYANNGKAQARILMGGKKIDNIDEVEFTSGGATSKYPKFTLKKLDAATKKTLDGAKFTIGMVFTSNDGNTYNMNLSDVPTSDGAIEFDFAELKKANVDVAKLTKAVIKVKETEVPDSGSDRKYKLDDTEYTITLTLSEGEIKGYTIDPTYKNVTSNEKEFVITIYNTLEDEEIPEIEDLDIIELIKLSQDGKRLAGATFQINAPGGFQTEVVTKSTDIDRYITFGKDLLGYNNEAGDKAAFSLANGQNIIIGALEDVEKNNAAKLFDPKYLTKRATLTQKLRDAYVEKQVKEKMESAIKETNTWKKWEDILSQTKNAHDTYINSLNEYRSNRNYRNSTLVNYWIAYQNYYGANGKDRSTSTDNYKKKDNIENMYSILKYAREANGSDKKNYYNAMREEYLNVLNEQKNSWTSRNGYYEDWVSKYNNLPQNEKDAISTYFGRKYPGYSTNDSLKDKIEAETNYSTVISDFKDALKTETYYSKFKITDEDTLNKYKDYTENDVEYTYEQRAYSTPTQDSTYGYYKVEYRHSYTDYEDDGEVTKYIPSDGTYNYFYAYKDSKGNYVPLNTDDYKAFYDNFTNSNGTGWLDYLSNMCSQRALMNAYESQYKNFQNTMDTKYEDMYLTNTTINLTRYNAGTYSLNKYEQYRLYELTQEKMEKALKYVGEVFAKEQPKSDPNPVSKGGTEPGKNINGDTDRLKDWLWDKEIDKSNNVIKNYQFGYEIENFEYVLDGYYEMFGRTSNKIFDDNILKDWYVDGKDFASITIPFEYSAWKFSYEAKRWGYEYNVADLLRIYTGDIQLDITEKTAPKGYLLWKSGQMKTVILSYDNDGNNHEGHRTDTKFKDYTTDYSALDGKEIKRSKDNTYDITTLKMYNEADDLQTFRFNKVRVLNSDKSEDPYEPMENVEFDIEITAEHKDWKDNVATICSDGSPIQPLTKTFNKKTDNNGMITFTTKDYYDVGIDVLSRWTGKLTFKITEKNLETSHPQYIEWLYTRVLEVEYKDGVATVKAENYALDSAETSGILASAYAYNNPKGPELIIKKKDISDSALKGAEFEVTVSRIGAINGIDTNGVTLKDSITIKGETNEAGEIIIKAEDLKEIGLDVINRWTGTLNVRINEIKAPEGYKSLGNGNIEANIVYTDGKITNINIVRDAGGKVTSQLKECRFNDNEGYTVIFDIGTISIEEEKEARLRLRKVDGDTEKQDFLTGATFEVNVNGNSTRKTVDGNGYIDLTGTVNNLSEYTGTINVKIIEITPPSGGYTLISGEMEVSLTYQYGKCVAVMYPNDLSAVTLDVSDPEGTADITIAVKNTKLQPIYLSKVDKKTGVTIADVDFNVAIANAQTELSGLNNNRVITTSTSDDGVIAITTEELRNIRVEDNYNGELYILVDELETPTGYKKLAEKITVKVTYENGIIKDAEIIAGGNNAELKIAEISGNKYLKIIVKNDRELPELVISKETLVNGPNKAIKTAVLNVKIEADNGKSYTEQLKVNGSGELRYSGSFLEEKLGIDGYYSGILKVTVDEISVDDAEPLPEAITANLTLVDGRYVIGSVTNDVHMSIVNNEFNINIKVLDFKNEDEDIIIEGKVWKEQATTKGQGTVIDGLYTKTSDSEYSDQPYEGIVVTLYEKQGNNLVFSNVEYGTNPTVTDANGYYKFQVPKGKEYVVKFTYNGQVYQAATYKANSNTNGTEEYTKSSELQGNRNSINNLLKFIDSAPNNYKTNSPKFISSNYNTVYAYKDLVDVYEAIEEVVIDTLKNNQYIQDLDSVYRTVASRYSSIPEINNKLQYIYDIKLDAYAEATPTNKPAVIDSTANVNSYTDNAKYVDLAVYARDRSALSLVSRIAETKVAINGKETTYDMRDVIDVEYNQYIYREDYNHDKETNNADGIAYYDGNKPLDLYVTYEMEVRNDATAYTQATGIDNYYDSGFDFDKMKIDGYKAFRRYLNSQNQIVEDDVTGLVSQITPTGETFNGANGTTYKKSVIKFNTDDSNFDKLKLGQKDKIIIQITYKMENATPELLRRIGNNINDVWRLTHYSEINGYKTMEGYLDAYSKPGNFSVTEYENAKEEYINAYRNKKKDNDAYVKALEKIEYIREQDAWCTILNIRNNIEGSDYYHRKLTGNVWKVADTYTAAQLEYNADKKIEGIIVELLEVKDGVQKVVARTVTDSEGKYTFANYIPGDYTVRFIYGTKTRDGYNNPKIEEAARVYNGQYYQSANANDVTNNDIYWYAPYKLDASNNKIYRASSNENLNETGFTNSERWSDAYDEVKSRIEQIEHRIQKADGSYVESDSRSWTYEIDGVEALQRGDHTDKIDAYTSTLELEVEFTKKKLAGSKGYSYYRYDLDNVDFGLTPRPKADMDINKYISNVKIYLQDGTKQLDVDFALQSDGSIQPITPYNNDPIYRNIVTAITNTNAYKDGLVEVILDEALFNGATMEVEYTMEIENKGEYSRLKYFYENSSINESTDPIAVAYYSENANSLVYYEGNQIVTHDASNETYKKVNNGYNSGAGLDLEVRSRVTNIVDYVDPNLTFIQVDKEGSRTNADWEITNVDSFVSTRENVEIDGLKVIDRHNTLLRPKGTLTAYNTYKQYLSECARLGQDIAEDNIRNRSDISDIYAPVSGFGGSGENKASTTLTLSQVLQTSSTDTNDHNYTNIIELIRIENYAGKVAELEAYDVTGEIRPESSEIETAEFRETQTDEIKATMPSTLGTSKAETISIHAPTGLNAFEEIQSNIVIVLVALVVFAGGIVLIKKFILNPKKVN